MHFALLLSGIYLGGVFFALFDGWIRDEDPFRNEALFGAAVWPLLIVWLLSIGKHRAREAIGFHPIDARVVEATDPAPERGPYPPDFDFFKDVAKEARARAIVEALLQVDFYRLDVEAEGRPADLVELTQRIHALIDPTPEVEDHEGTP